MEYTPPPHIALDIYYKDEYLLVINKPSGLLSVPGRGEDKQDCLISRVQSEYPDSLIVHRLDMSTSGLMLLARGKELERSLSILFQNREINKKYIAVVDGKIMANSGVVDLPLITDWPNRPKQKVDFETGKSSITSYRRLSFNKNNNTSRLELVPFTGRTHQLRVHLMSINNAILGDELYANKDAREKAARLLLHASYLSFQHPVTGEFIEIKSEPEF
ncbi:MAG: pseudouridine synthase [Gammaproteobacteria bacterium]|nr:pseudouridine synthase [Gammaproteobacteria bacterium]MCW8988601.1 pseudouridine synthase [Gammaproteobacteria bacterium]